MNVTKTEACSRTRFKVYIDGKFSFVLYKGEMRAFGIRESAEVSQETLQKILTDVVLRRARLRALHLLEDMDRTETALREKLRQGLYPPQIIDQAVDYVKSFGYLNDARYAENYIRSRAGSKSRKEIRAGLIGKGLDPEVIREAFEICAGETGEEDAIRSILKKKRFDPSCKNEGELQKIYGYLGRKGFRYETVRQVIQNYNEDA